MRYEITADLIITCFNAQNLEILRQPTKADGTAWASKKEAEAWIQAWIAEQEAAALVIPEPPVE